MKPKHTEFELLRRRWRRKTKSEMPPEIARLEIELMRVAVERTVAGETVFLPKEPVSRPEDRLENQSSLQYWDSER